MAPCSEKRDVGRVREHGGLEARDDFHLDRRDFEHVFGRDTRLERRDRLPDILARADGAKHDFGFRGRRYDVRRHAAADQADRVVRLAEHRIFRQRQPAQVDQRVDQRVDRGNPEFGKG